MRVVSLFTGAGGLDLGLEQAGHEIIMQCESDPGAQQVLRHQFPGTLLMPDVCSIQRLPEGCDILAAGIPCIDVSCAGQRKGMSGLRTSLVQHVFRLLQQAQEDRRPVPWLLLENVEALLNKHDGLHGEAGKPVISYIAQEVEALGYQSWAYRIVNTAAFGLPHQRRRVLFLASMYGDARDLLLSTGLTDCTGSCADMFDGRLCFRCKMSEEVSPDDTNYAVDLSNARNSGIEELLPTMTTTNLRTLLMLSDGRAGFLRLADAERLQGFEGGWTEKCYPIQGSAIEANRRHTASRDLDDSVCKRARYGLIGNAVSVPVARWIGERLAAPCGHKYLRGQNVDEPMVRAPRAAPAPPPASRPSQRHNGRIEAIKAKKAEEACRKAAEEAGLAAATKTWPRAGWYVAGVGRYAAGVSDAPVRTPMVPLDECTEPGAPPGEDALRVYIARLREGGFNVSVLLTKFQQCGIGTSLATAKVVPGHRSETAAIAAAVRADRRAAQAAESDAAARALEISRQARCGECLSCSQQRQGGTSRRCLKLRAAAAAASGHSGAQIAMMKEAAVGCRISVWWSEDEVSYDGEITVWDPFRWSHSVRYDDNEVEVISLWAPHEVVVLRELPKPKKRRTNGGSGAADGAPAKRTKKQAQGTNNTSETSGSGGGGGSGGGSSALAGKTADAMPSSTAGDPNTITKIANAADAARANGLPADRSKSQNKKRAGKPVRTSSKSGTHTRDDNPAGASLGTEEEAVAATPNTNADGANLSVKEGANASSIMPNSTVNGDELSTGGRATSQECISRVGPPALDHTSLPGVAETAVTLLVA
mmetsp:Transcript_8743/g.26158  ORF Transcript_8743/g.26158 Transcript_8743/m.26158 type:complete len:819 (+) Transcript_8743:109-2565(+)